MNIFPKKQWKSSPFVPFLQRRKTVSVLKNINGHVQKSHPIISEFEIVWGHKNTWIIFLQLISPKLRKKNVEEMETMTGVGRLEGE